MSVLIALAALALLMLAAYLDTALSCLPLSPRLARSCLPTRAR